MPAWLGHRITRGHTWIGVRLSTSTLGLAWFAISILMLLGLAREFWLSLAL